MHSNLLELRDHPKCQRIGFQKKMSELHESRSTLLKAMLRLGPIRDCAIIGLGEGGWGGVGNFRVPFKTFHFNLF